MSRTTIDYAPFPKQNLFHACGADEALFGGSAGPGKSTALAMEALIRDLETPGYKAALFRRTFPELEDSLIPMLNAIVPRELGTYNETKHRWTFPHGGDKAPSTLRMCFCEKRLDVHKYQSAEFDFIGFDELTHFEEYQYLYLISRVRKSQARGRKPVVRAATNPGGVGHGWVKRRFMIGDPRMKPGAVWTPAATREDPEPLSRCFIPATVWDNPAIVKNDPQYISRLNALPVEVRKALRDGDWTITAGQAFPEFAKPIHILAHTFTIRPDWKRFVWIDYGYTQAFCALWAAQSPDGRLYIYRELYGPGMTDREQAARVAILSGYGTEQGRGGSGGELISQIVAGHDCWRKGEKGKTIAEVYQAVWRDKGLQCPITLGSQDRKARKVRVHDALALAPDGKPWLQIFPTCTNLIRTLEDIITDPVKLEDVDTTCEDHAYDALSIGLMARPESFPTNRVMVQPIEKRDPASVREWELVAKMMEKFQGRSEGGSLAALNNY